MNETLDKLYLELSNITSARNSREINLAIMIRRLCRAVDDRKCESLIEKAEGLLNRYGLKTEVYESILRKENEE